MSKYSSDSDDNDYKGKNSRRKRRRKAMSDSSSSRDSYVESSRRRSRKSRSHSRDSYRTPSKNSYKDKRSSLKDKGRSQRSRSPYRNRSRSRRRYRSTSRSRSRSRTSSNNYAKKKSYSKSKRKYKSRSRSRSRHRKSRSHSRRRSRSKQKYRSRSRSSSSTKKLKRSSIDGNGHDRSSSSDDSVKLDGKHLQELQRRIQKDVDSKKNIKQEPFNSYTSITIPSDDPIVKQEQLDDINASSFTPRAFKSSKNSNHPDENPLLSAVKLDNELNKLCNSNLGDRLTITNDNGDEKRKNETVFHDSIAFEDSEQKIQKWVKKLFILRQKFLYGYSNWDKRES